MGIGGFAPLPLRLGCGTTDENRAPTAEQQARLCADAVAVKRTQPLAVVNFTIDDDVGGCTLVSYAGQNGVGSSHAPLLLGAAVNVVTFSWSFRYEDDYGVSEPWHVLAANVTRSSSSAAPSPTYVYLAAAAVNGPNAIQVNGYDVGAYTLTVW